MLLLCAGCASARMDLDVEDFEQEIERLERRLLSHPDDAGALRDLGVIYARSRRFSQAYDYLKSAFAQDPDDAETLFFLGVATEATGNHEAAIRIYERYRDVPRTSPYRGRLRARHQLWMRQLAREEAQRIAAQFESLDTAPASPEVVAVYPLVYRGSEDRFAPLGRGLSEMISEDLAKVRSLRVVERVRLQAVLDELDLAGSGRVDPATAPRSGRLLGAGRAVTGTFDVAGGDELRLDVGLMDTRTGALPEMRSDVERLQQFYQAQKALVFRLIEEMGIELSPAERQAIELVPTQDLQAFLAYSRGLREEDAGNFGAAARHFSRASSIDPGFEQAAEHAEFSDAMTTTHSDPQAAIESIVAPPAPVVDLVQDRLFNLNESVGATVVPGEESRQPAGGDEPANPVQPLPDPPPPPDNGGN